MLDSMFALLGCVTTLEDAGIESNAEGRGPLLPVLTALRKQNHQGDDTSAISEPTPISIGSQHRHH
jgi:hypothetical protein